MPNVDPMSGNGAAMKQATENGFDGCVALLLRHAAVDPTVDEQFCVRWAAMRGLMRSMKVRLCVMTRCRAITSVDSRAAAAVGRRACRPYRSELRGTAMVSQCVSALARVSSHRVAAGLRDLVRIASSLTD